MFNEKGAKARSSSPLKEGSKVSVTWGCLWNVRKVVGCGKSCALWQELRYVGTAMVCEKSSELANAFLLGRAAERAWHLASSVMVRT